MFFLIPYLLFSVHLLNGEDKDTVNVYRSRQLGDKAFKDKDYLLAVKFYRKYKDEASEDTEALKDAFLCLISSCVHSGNAIEARKELKEFNSEFSRDISRNLELKQKAVYWNANILLLEEKFSGALNVFNSLLKKVQPDSEFYFQILSGLGFANAKLLEWEVAENVYSKMEAEGQGTKWAEYGRKQKILAILMKGDIEKARQLIDKTPAGDNAALVYNNLLRIFLLIKEEKIAEANTLYKQVRKYGGGPDSLWFLVASSLAKAFSDENNITYALPLLEDAEIFAETVYDTQDTLILIINVKGSLGNTDNAISASLCFLKNYPESSRANSVSLQLARLYSSSKKNKEAIETYSELVKDHNVELEIKLQAAREAALIFIVEKLYPDAKEKFDFIVNNTKNENLKAESKYWLAEILFRQAKYQEAADAFSRVAGNYKDWKEKALFRKIESILAMGNDKGALALLDTFLNEYKKGTLYEDALFLYATVLLKEERFNEAQIKFANFADSYPNHPDAPRALFEAGNIAFDNADFSYAEETYSKIQEKYREHPLAPNALYRKLYLHLLASNIEAGGKDMDLLFNDYPDSIFTKRGFFWLGDYYRDNQMYEKAEKIFSDIALKYASDGSIAAEALYEAAFVCEQAEKNNKAIQYLDELSEKYSNESIVSESFLLRGDIYSENNEYEKAIPFYKKAAERRPESELEKVCWGRLGDCYFSLAWKTPDGSNLLRAIKFYKKILEWKDISPNFRNEVLYKLAKCDELMGDKGASLAKYHEVIYNYEIDVEKGEVPDSLWLVKAVLAAERLELEKEKPKAEWIISLYRKLIELGIEPKNDYEKRINELREEFKLKE